MTAVRGLALALLVIALATLFLVDNLKATIALVIVGCFLGLADTRRAKKH